MTTYFTGDFADFSTCSGSSCGDWTQRYNDRADWTVSGGDLITTAGRVNDFSGLTWNDIDGDASRDDAEVLVKLTVGTLSSAIPYVVAVRMSGVDEAPYQYAVRFSVGTLRAQYTAGSDTATQIANVSKAFNDNTTYWFRFRVVGTSIKVRAWEDGTSEPGTWDIDTTDSNVTGAGWVGFTQFAAATGNAYTAHQIGVGTGGDTAPASVTSGITGTGSLTNSAVTASGSGTLAHTGTGAASTNVVSLSGAGTLSHTGTGSLTTATTTASGSGTATGAGVTGSGAIAVGAVATSGAGKLTHSGSGALSGNVVSITGSGTLAHTGTGAVAVGNVTLSGTDSLGITGAGAILIGNVLVSGTGNRIGWDAAPSAAGSWADASGGAGTWTDKAASSGTWINQ